MTIKRFEINDYKPYTKLLEKAISETADKFEKAKPRIGKKYSQQPGRKAGKGAGHIVNERDGDAERDKQKEDALTEQEGIKKLNPKMMSSLADAFAELNRTSTNTARYDIKSAFSEGNLAWQGDNKLVYTNAGYPGYDFTYDKEDDFWYVKETSDVSEEERLEEMATQGLMDLQSEKEQADEPAKEDLEKAKPGKPYSQQMRKQGKGAGKIVANRGGQNVVIAHTSHVPYDEFVKKPNLPTKVNVPKHVMDSAKEDESISGIGQSDAVANYLSDEYGFLISEMKIKSNPNGTGMAYDINWDTSDDMEKGIGKPYSQQPGRRPGEGAGHIVSRTEGEGIDLPGEIMDEDAWKEQEALKEQLGREAFQEQGREQSVPRYKEMVFDPSTFRDVAARFHPMKGWDFMELMGGDEAFGKIWQFGADHGWIAPTDKTHGALLQISQMIIPWAAKASDDEIKEFQQAVFSQKHEEQNEEKSEQDIVNEILPKLGSDFTYAHLEQTLLDAGYDEETANRVWDYIQHKYG